MPNLDGPTGSQELTGWKAVAEYLHVSVRTAQQFEKTKGLPVHRGAGVKPAIFAIASELDEWREEMKSDFSTSLSRGAALQTESPGHEERLTGRLSLAAWFAALVTAAMFATSVVMEVAYGYDQYRQLIWTAAPLVFLWTFLCIGATLLMLYRVRFKRTAVGLGSAIALFSLGNALQYSIVRPLLPPTPVTLATFQTWTAQAAYLKDVVYCAAFVCFFLIVPFQSVIALMSHVRQGRQNEVYPLLTGARRAVTPRGTLFLRPVLLWTMLVVGAIWSVVSTAHLLEALILTPYTNLFILTIQIRWALFLILGAGCCWWYYLSVEDLKRESAFDPE
jgi:hypothetical protein